MENEGTQSELLSLLDQALARELQVSIQYMLQKAIGTSQAAAADGKTRTGRQIKFVASRTPYWLLGKSLNQIFSDLLGED